jgi:peptidoglycan/LPS O-acetylase OafA/YrhL
MNEDAHRILPFDTLRAVAILSVFANHALMMPLGWIGVDVFFVLSGFLITSILLKRKAVGHSYFSYFYERRARRILPPYLLLLVITTATLGTVWMRHWYWFAFFGANIASAIGQSGYTALSPLWSLAVEEQFYCLWPVAVLFLSDTHLAFLAGTLLVLAPILRGLATPYIGTHFAVLIHPHHVTPIYYLTPFRMDLLAAGALLAILWRRRPDSVKSLSRYAPYGTAACLCLLLLLGRTYHLHVTADSVLNNVLLFELSLLLAVCAVITCLCASGRLYSILTWKPLLYIGTISYSMYLVHLLIIDIVRTHVSGRLSTAAISLCLTSAYAALSWITLERPLLNRKHRLVRNKPLSASLRAACQMDCSPSSRLLKDETITSNAADLTNDGDLTCKIPTSATS